MIECICINDKDRPSKIPIEKWVKEGEKYHVIYTTVVLPQRQLAFYLSEIELTDNELPYEYFLASRFAFHPKDIDAMMKLIKDCDETDFGIEELMEQTKIKDFA